MKNSSEHAVLYILECKLWDASVFI